MLYGDAPGDDAPRDAQWLHNATHPALQVLPIMRRQGYGRILNVASIAGKDGNAGMLAYSSSKAAVVGLTSARALYRRTVEALGRLCIGELWRHCTTRAGTRHSTSAVAAVRVARGHRQGVRRERDHVQRSCPGRGPHRDGASSLPSPLSGAYYPLSRGPHRDGASLEYKPLSASTARPWVACVRHALSRGVVRV